MHIFIDTNVFLNFYHYSDEDLNRLNDLIKLIEANRVKLYLTKQVIDEFNRNREVKINDAIRKFKSSHTDIGLPRICDGYEEKRKIKDALDILKTEKKKLTDKLLEDARNKALLADKLIARVFKISSVGIISKELLDASKKRYDLGNPPGKKGSYGDAINWMYLLGVVPNGQDLYLVSNDKDYASPLAENEFSLFLQDEWMSRKNSSVIFFSSLNTFFKTHLPEVEITGEDIKDGKIKALVSSSSFDQSRKDLALLAEIGDFSISQINEIVQASVNTFQIYGAHKYSPELVGDVLKELIKGHEHQIDPFVYEEFCQKFDLGLQKKLVEKVPF